MSVAKRGRLDTRRRGFVFQGVKQQMTNQTDLVINNILANAILSKVYGGQQVHESVLSAIIEWLDDPDTKWSDSETVESLAADWIEVAHRES